MSKTENKDLIDKIWDYFLIAWGLFEFVILPICIVVYLIWEFEIFYSSNNKNLYLTERVIYGDSIFEKYHKINYTIYPETQTIIQNNLEPVSDEKLKKKFKPDLKCLRKKNFEDNKVKCSKSIVNIDKAKYVSSLPDFTESIKKLKNCVIKNEENWICNSTIKYTNLPTKFFGLKDGSWIIDKSYKGNLKNWKIFWVIDKLRCDDICYIGSVKKINEGNNKFKKYMIEQMIKRNQKEQN